MTSHELLILFLQLGVLLAVARLLGEATRRLGQPALLGEILAGILLGPTLFGAVAPAWYDWLFVADGRNALFLEGFTALSIALFLLVAGIEVDLSIVWKQGRATILVGLAGMVFPFAIAFLPAWFAPGLLGVAFENERDHLIFALFFATAISITSLPFIAKTLMDLSLYRSDMGMIVIAAAIFNDLVGWIVFAIVLSMMGIDRQGQFTLWHTIGLTLVFTAGILTIGRWLINRILPWIQAHTTWPGGVLSFSLAAALLGAAFTEWIGVHAIFGAFLMGVAIGDSPHLRESTRTIIHQFVSFVFAPIFFASIGLQVNFVTSFDALLVVVVLVIATLGKLPGCYLGARLAGISERESWAIGFGMNARGAMQIILGLLALKYGMIGEPLFVALVIMALLTAAGSGPIMQRILHLRRPRRFSDFLSSKAFARPLEAPSAEQAIHTLAPGLAAAAGLSADLIEQYVLARERIMSTGIGNGLAVPHGRVPGLSKPVVAVGLSPSGVDFNAPDAEAAHIVLMIAIPEQHDGTEVEILADIARTFRDPETREAALKVGGYTEFLALMKSKDQPAG